MSATKTCDLCQKFVDDPVELGPIMKKSEIQVHYYCLLVSTHLPQRGTEEDGIFGFFLTDIRKEIRATKDRICYYCDSRSANVQCNKCDRYYHLVCGLKNDCLFQFFDEFKSYCHNHFKIKYEKKPDPTIACYICLEPIGTYNPVTSMTAKCCELGWTHRRCMKEYALYTGYYLQCLWCRSKSFRHQARRHGVFVPDRDALRYHKGSYQAMCKKYVKCDALVCLCSRGRTFNGSSAWEMLVCDTCAVSGSHKECLPKNRFGNGFQCKRCFENLTSNLQLSRTNLQKRTGQQLENDDQLSDVSLFMEKFEALDDDCLISDQPLQSPESIKEEKSLAKNNVPKTCDLCHKCVDDPVELGVIMRKGDIQVHYYCLLASTHLPQKGKEQEGILGFLLADICREFRASENRICYYCDGRHANVVCEDCKRCYHLVCGLKNDCLFQFCDYFISYCHVHSIIEHKKKPDPMTVCYICVEPIGTYNPVTSMTANCCELGWAHRRCMKEYALYTGHYLQCLWCRSKSFRHQARRHGVFVPDRDALRYHKGSYQAMCKKYVKCDALVCLCSRGRTFKGSSAWKMLVCDTCAVSGMHKECLPKNRFGNGFQCQECLKVLSIKPQLSQPFTRKKTGQQLENADHLLDVSLFMEKLGAYDDESDSLDESFGKSSQSV